MAAKNGNGKTSEVTTGNGNSPRAGWKSTRRERVYFNNAGDRFPATDDVQAIFVGEGKSVTSESKFGKGMQTDRVWLASVNGVEFELIGRAGLDREMEQLPQGCIFYAERLEKVKLRNGNSIWRHKVEYKTTPASEKYVAELASAKIAAEASRASA